MRTAPRDSLIAASSPPETLGRAYGLHRSLDSLGAAIGPLIAFWILTVVVNGYHAVFVVSLGFAAIGVAVLLLIVPDLRPRRQASRYDSAKPGKVTFRHLANPQVARLLIAATLLGLVTVGDAFLYLALQLRDNLANYYYALLMVGMNLSYLIVAVPLGRLADRIGRAKVFVGGHVALLGCYLCAAGPISGPVLSIGCLVLLGTYYGAADGTLAALAGRAVDPSIRTSSIATAQTFVALAAFVSSLAVGALWSRDRPAEHRPVVLPDPAALPTDHRAGHPRRRPDANSMSMRARLAVLGAVCILALGAAIGYLVSARHHQDVVGRHASPVAQTSLTTIEKQPRIVFRNTALGPSYGMVAMVAPSDPAGPRIVTGTSCDRVYATSKNVLCLSSDRGIITTYAAHVLNNDMSRPRRCR